MNAPDYVTRYTIDRDGAPVVLVPLTRPSGLFAKIDPADYDRLIAAGVPLTWFVVVDPRGHRHIRVAMHSAGRSLVTVARLIMCPPRRFIVRHQDGDALNLRRSNLHLEYGNRGGEWENDFMASKGVAITV